MRATLAGFLLAVGLTGVGLALPEGPSPAAGSVQIQQPAAGLMQILQSSPQAIVNWNGFSIGPQERVFILQPGAASVLLNRVTGLDPSVIQGMLQANGRVFLLNPNGILFGPGASLDVGSFVASTLHMSDSDFLAGRYHLVQGSQPLAAIVNQGEIRVGEGGFVVLVAPMIHQDGLIVAQSGQVNLGATRQASLSLDGQGLVQLVVPDGFDPHFTGGGQGGTVLLTPGQTSQILNQVVSSPSLSEATSFQGNQLVGGEGLLVHSGQTEVGSGRVRLDSSQATVVTPGSRLEADGLRGAGEVRVLSAGTTLSGGSLSAASPLGAGGLIEVSGRHLGLGGVLNVTSGIGQHGEVLLDPTDLTIVAASGSLDPSLPTITNSTGGASESVSVSAIAAIFGTVTLQATNNVTFTGTTFNAPNTNLNISAGNDIVFSNTGFPTDLTLTLASLNFVAGQDLTIQSTGGTSTSVTANTGDIRLEAGRNMSLSSAADQTFRSLGGQVVIQGGNVSSLGQNVNFDASGDLSMNSAGRIHHFGPGGSLNLQSDLGKVQINADTVDLTGAQVAYRSPQSVTINATTDALLNDQNRTVLGTPNLNVTSGRDILMTTFLIQQGVLSNLTLDAGRDLDLAGTSGLDLTVDAHEMNFSAGRDLRLHNDSGSQAYTSGGNLILDAGRNLSTDAFTTTQLFTTGGDISVTGGNQTHTANQAVYWQSSGAIQASSPTGNVTFQPGTTLTLLAQGGNATVQGNNLSLNSPNRMDLTGQAVVLNATTDVVLNTTADIVRWSAPQASITAGQDVRITALGVNQASASNLTVQAGRDFLFNNQPGTDELFTLNDIHIQATRDLRFQTTNANLNLLSNNALDLSAGRNLVANATFDQQLLATTALRAQSGNLTTGGRDLTVSGVGLNLTTTGDLNLDQTGVLRLNAHAGDLRVDGNNLLLRGQNSGIQLSGATATVHSNLDTSVRSAATVAVAVPNFSMQAGRDLDINVPALNQSSTNNVSLQSTRDLLLTVPSITVNDLQAQSGRNLTLTAPGDQSTTATGGNVALVATGSLSILPGNNELITAPNGQVLLQGSSLNMTGQNLQVSGGTGAALRSTNGNLQVNAGTALTLGGGTGTLTVNALNGSAALNSTGTQTLTGNALSINATTDVNLTTPNGISLSSHQGSLHSGQDTRIFTPSFGQNTSTNLTIAADRDLTLTQPAGNAQTVNFQNLTMRAGRDLLLDSPGASRTVTTSQNLTLTAGRNLTAQAGTAQAFNVGQQATIQGQNVTFSGTDLDLRGSGLNLTATTGDLSTNQTGVARFDGAAGTANLQAGGNLDLQASNGIQLAGANTMVNGSSRLTMDGGNTGFNFSSANVNLQSSGNVIWDGRHILQSTPTNVTVRNSGDFVLSTLPGVDKTVSLNNLDVQAAGAVRLNAPAASLFLTSANDLKLVGDQGVFTNTTVDLSLTATGQVLLQGPTVSFTGHSLTTTGDSILFQSTAGDVNLAATGILLFVPGSQSTHLSALGGSVSLLAPGLLDFRGTQPTILDATSDIILDSAAQVLVEAPFLQATAQRDLVFHTPALTAHHLQGTAGQDVSLDSGGSGVNLQASFDNVTLSATRDLVWNTPAAGISFTTTGLVPGNLDLSAGRNLIGNCTNDISLGSNNGNLRLAGQNVTLTGRIIGAAATGNLTVDARKNFNLDRTGTGQMTGSDIGLNLGTVNVTASTPVIASNHLVGQGPGNLDLSSFNLSGSTVDLNAPGNLKFNQLAGNNVQISGGNVVVTSMANVSGGNYTFNTPGNLTELVANNAPTLQSLNITTGRIFGNGNNVSFSIPATNASLDVLVNSGNDTVLNAAGSMTQLNGAHINLHTIPPTGDIYIDGVLVYQGLPPVPPPPPPPPPPPAPPVNNNVAPPSSGLNLTPEQLAELQNQLAQDNLALGNLGPFSSTLSDTERERLTIRDRSLRNPYPEEPFAPTLSLVLGRGLGNGLDEDLRWLDFSYAAFLQEMLDKDRAAFNAMLDLEVTEMWEVRYWRKLLESIILWEE